MESINVATEAADAVVCLNDDGAIVEWNDAAESLYGYSAADMLGESAAQLFEISSDFDRMVPRVRAGGRFDGVAMTHRHRDGRLMTVEITASQVGGANAGVSMIVRDVTASRAMTSYIAQHERLEALGRLAATMSHEFRAVLMTIQPFVELIDRRSSSDDSLRKLLDPIRRAVRRGRRITDEILSFTGAAPRPELEPIAANEFLQRTMDDVAALFPANITVRVELGEPSLAFWGDEDQLAEVVTNLALNARDAMPNGGELSVGVTRPSEHQRHAFGLDGRPDDWVLLCFRDSGQGIDPTLLPQIFEPLFTTKRGGTGLGLAVVSQIVRRHGGRIEVRSESGRGTTFYVLLRNAMTEGAAAPFRRILIVDDEPTIVSGLVEALRAQGFDTVSIAHGRDVVRAVEVLQPDGVVLDVRLSDADGLEICDMLRSRWPSLPIVLMSGAAVKEEVERRTSGYGRVRFLAKPFLTSELLEAFDSLE
ncbi:MAG: response regulator [Acidobacteria bacterium]|nr:response regulator [Acidobacteriota bacterium]